MGVSGVGFVHCDDPKIGHRRYLGFFFTQMPLEYVRTGMCHGDERPRAVEARRDACVTCNYDWHGVAGP